MAKGKITQLLQEETYSDLHLTTEMINLKWGRNWKCMQILPYKLHTESD